MVGGAMEDQFEAIIAIDLTGGIPLSCDKVVVCTRGERNQVMEKMKVEYPLCDLFISSATTTERVNLIDIAEYTAAAAEQG